MDEPEVDASTTQWSANFDAVHDLVGLERLPEWL